ncbi:MAG: DUF4258 domain-containing protein [Candidatus Methanospirareceae archaeon]
MNLFEVHAVTCVKIRTTESYWRYVMEVKHPESFKTISFETAVSQVKETLSEPEVVLRGKVDPSVYLYYRRFHGYLTCVVAKHLNAEGFILTVYRTDRQGGGEVVWGRR